MNDTAINVTMLGQVGVRLEYGDTVIYVDPYLSNSVQEKEDQNCMRLIPVPVQPSLVSDAKYILITHEHRDHCDEDTLKPLASASSGAIFVCPEAVYPYLLKMGIQEKRIEIIREHSLQLDENITIYAVPSAHPKVEVNPKGGWIRIGYFIKIGRKRLYHAGDTSVSSEIIDRILSLGGVDVAFLPVNERNYYRDSMGILGNMSVREAFQLAEDIKVNALVPTHWDMFALNQVYQEEIELLYDKIQPDFRLLINPTTL